MNERSKPYRLPDLTAATRTAALLAILTAIYFALGKAGLALASVNPSATPVWAPSGVALAAMLLFGFRVWPAVFLGALLVNLATDAHPAAIVIAVGNTLEAVLMAAILKRFAGGAQTFETPGRVALFSFAAFLSGTLISPTIGVSTLCLSGSAPWSQFVAIWMTWWLGDSTGALVVTPVVVLWAESLKTPVRAGGASASVLASAAVVGLIAFSPLLEPAALRAPLAFLAIIPLLAAALRLDQRDTATVALILTAFAVWGTLARAGPFVGPEMNTSLLLLAAFMVSVTVPSLILSAEVAQRRRAEHALRQQESESRAIFRQALVGIAEYDAGGRLVAVNEKFCEMARTVESELLTMRMADLTEAEDFERETPLFANACATGDGYVIEKRLVRSDGPGPWVRTTVTPIIDRSGKVRRLAVMCEDITQRHSDDERQRLLMAELSHRVRNNLATIQAIARLTARSAATKAEYVESLQGRISAMARTHSLLTRDRWQGASLRDLVHDELSAYARAGTVALDGPSITLGTRHAIDLALVLHELATNAAKYGALSVPEGKVSVVWSTPVIEGEPHLALEWRESGGPRVQKPARKGFGAHLIETALAGAGSKVTLDYPPEGACCQVDMPLVRSAAKVTPLQQPQNPPPPQVLARHRVLLVEDDPVLGIELQSALSDSGLDVVGPVATVDEALALAAKLELSAAVLDIHLGGLMVFPVAEHLRARGLPLLFITGYDIEAVAPGPLRQAPVMQKPVNIDMLVSRVKELLAAA